MRTLEERHPDLGEHVDGVAAMAAAVARRLGLDDAQVERIAHAARLHDVGKVAIPDAILAKPEPLEPEEREFIQRHTIIGERIIAAAPALTDVARLVRSSHERWDGTGYPDELAGEAIPLGARIVSACDAYDAMITDRPYQAAVDSERACAELRRCAGTQFDPGVVPAFVAVIAARQGAGSAPEPAVA
jgi:HD-GYP domain-containing protein (c-di-GMP phosphodiesterase class II)